MVGVYRRTKILLLNRYLKANYNYKLINKI